MAYFYTYMEQHGRNQTVLFRCAGCSCSNHFSYLANSTMGIFSRFADIINSNLNAMLDKAEDPEKMIALIIQEMEETLVEGRSNLARMLADKKDLTRQLEARKAEAVEWEAKAKLAVEKDRDDLAKAALLERDGVNRDAQAIDESLTSIHQQLSELTVELEQLHEKLDNARAKQKSLVLRSKVVAQRYKVKSQTEKLRVGDSLDKFAAFERKLDALEGKVESLNITRSTLKDEIDNFASNEALESELAQLKEALRS